MLKIGLTGGIAVGKSTVCKLFSYYGITVIDADVIAHQLVKPRQKCLDNIINIFGEHMLLDNGNLDRPRLRQLIFFDYKARWQLEKIIHPKINEQQIKQSEMASSYYCVLSIPLLFETGTAMLVDRTLLIESSVKHQITRVCQRDDISILQAKAIINSQLSSTQKRSKADDIIHNNRSPEDLTTIVERLHKQYMNVAKATL